MQEFLIGRQQIFDRDLNVFAYELLFRDAQGRSPQEVEATEASNQVIVNSLLEEGLERMVGPHRAFINFTRDNLLSGTAHLLPKDKVVVEVLESVAIDQALIDAVASLVRAGYMIALDDFVFSDQWLPLLKLAHIVKLDILNMPPGSGRRQMDLLRPFSLKFLAEKVETHAQFSEYRDLGCDYFQGFFFSRPHIVQGKRADTARLPILRLLSEINRQDVEITELANIISMDARLSYKLLRYLNTSAAFGLRREINSITHAIVMLGLQEIRRWASLLALVSLPDTPREAIVFSLIRAKMCEQLALAAHVVHRGQSGEYFLTGLVSMLEQILNVPMEALVEELPLTEGVSKALTAREGLLGEALQCVLNYECWRLDEVTFAGLSLADIGQAYKESVAWANELAMMLNDVD